MSSYKPFRSRRGLHHFFLVRIAVNIWSFFLRSSWGMKIVFSGLVCIVGGLFSPWIEIGDSQTIGAFSLICGGIGWWMSGLVIFLLFHLFSFDFYEKIHKTWNLIDHKNLYLRVGCLVILMTILVSLSLTGAARSINSEIRMTTEISGLVLTLLGGILLCIGGYITRTLEEKQSYKHVFVQGVESEDQESYKKILGESEDENMKLPI